MSNCFASPFTVINMKHLYPTDAIECILLTKDLNGSKVI